jgi:hypothetical protein
MNERIKQLLNESTSGHVQETDRSKVMTVSDGEMEIFAELIVRECLALADNIREGCEVDGEAEQALGADWVGLAIARHFGVEE